MTFTKSINVNTPPEAIFSEYENISGWPSWDHDVAEVHIARGLQVGATGWLKPTSGPRVKLTVTEVTPGKSFTTESRLPLCTMTVSHNLKPLKSGVKVTHRATFRGPLSPVFKLLIGRAFVNALPGALARLKIIAESAVQHE